MEFPVLIPFVQAMGFELLRMQGGEAEIALALRGDQHNSLNMGHGGVTMTLLDVAMAHAARSADVPVEAAPGALALPAAPAPAGA
jgi:acyl-coenzyme A thioesterase PaaI-like protein